MCVPAGEGKDSAGQRRGNGAQTFTLRILPRHGAPPKNSGSGREAIDQLSLRSVGVGAVSSEFLPGRVGETRV